MNQTRTTEKNKAVRQVLEQANHVILGKSEEIKEIIPQSQEAQAPELPLRW